MSNLIVRADYYNDGTIIPISVFYNNRTYSIDNIVRRIKTSNNQYKFICLSDGIEVVLTFNYNIWSIIIN